MTRRRIGRHDVSVVGLGCNAFGRRCDEGESAAVVGAALDAGISFFDTADIYSRGLSEEFLGKALRGVREDVVVATKFGGPMGDDPASRGGSARWVARAIEGSLRRLGTDRIDLYQMHFPDPDVPVAETLEALAGLVRDGKVVEVGCSNFSGAQIDEAIGLAAKAGLPRFASAQNNYSLLHRTIESDVVPACERHGLGLIPYFPLANGLLTGKYRRGIEPPQGTRLSGLAPDQRGWILSDRNFDLVERLEGWAGANGRSLLEVAISWLASRPAVATVIAGARTPDQVAANVAAAASTLSEEAAAEIDAITAD
jgi:aryl-alcohol dehydrogenase-like predicted oxidoreductase